MLIFNGRRVLALQVQKNIRPAPSAVSLLSFWLIWLKKEWGKSRLLVFTLTQHPSLALGFCPQVKNGFFVIQQAGLRSKGDDRTNPSISLTLFSLEAERRWFSAKETTWTEFHWGNLAGDYRQKNVSSTTSKVLAVIAKWSFLHQQQRRVSQITIKSILVMTVYCLHDILHVRKEVKNKSGEVMEQKQS